MVSMARDEMQQREELEIFSFYSAIEAKYENTEIEKMLNAMCEA